MFARYHYAAGCTQAQLLADIVALLTGTTDKSLLSAGCDKNSTEIHSGYRAAGWTVHDAAAGTNRQVLKAPCEGEPGLFKFIGIDTNTAGYLQLLQWESWNATTHVGTNQSNDTMGTAQTQQKVALSQGGTLVVAANAQLAFLLGSSVSGVGNTNSGAPTMVAEFSRIGWNDVGSGFTPAGWIYSPSAGLAMPRLKSRTNSIITTQGSGAINAVLVGFGINYANGAGYSTCVIDQSTNPIQTLTGNYHPVTSIGFSTVSSSNASNGNYIGTLDPTGLLALANPAGALFDEIEHNGKTYVLVPVCVNTSNPRYMVEKG
jgi:hypothetical protein